MGVTIVGPKFQSQLMEQQKVFIEYALNACCFLLIDICRHLSINSLKKSCTR